MLWPYEDDERDKENKKNGFSHMIRPPKTKLRHPRLLLAVPPFDNPAVVLLVFMSSALFISKPSDAATKVLFDLCVELEGCVL